MLYSCKFHIVVMIVCQLQYLSNVYATTPEYLHESPFGEVRIFEVNRRSVVWDVNENIVRRHSSTYVLHWEFERSKPTELEWRVLVARFSGADHEGTVRTRVLGEEVFSCLPRDLALVGCEFQVITTPSGGIKSITSSAEARDLLRTSYCGKLSAAMRDEYAEMLGERYLRGIFEPCITVDAWCEGEYLRSLAPEKWTLWRSDVMRGWSFHKREERSLFEINLEHGDCKRSISASSLCTFGAADPSKPDEVHLLINAETIYDRCTHTVLSGVWRATTLEHDVVTKSGRWLSRSELCISVHRVE